MSNPKEIQYSYNSININTSQPLMTVPNGIMQPGGGFPNRKDIPEIEIFDPDGGKSIKSSPAGKSPISHKSLYKKSYLGDTKSSRGRV